jgi:hydrogenase maturation protease
MATARCTYIINRNMIVKRKKPRILIAGLGNLLLQDDGIGVHAVRELQKSPPRRTLVVEIGTWVLDSLHLLEWADRVLVIDAMQAGGPPGTLYLCGDGDVADPQMKASLHELSLISVLKFLPETERPEIRVLGVEPKKIDYGLELSHNLQACLPGLIRTVHQLIAQWQPGASEPSGAMLVHT